MSNSTNYLADHEESARSSSSPSSATTPSPFCQNAGLSSSVISVNNDGRSEQTRRNFVDVTDRKITPVQQMISSCFGAITTSLVVTPLDVVKVRLQKQVVSSSNGPSTNDATTLKSSALSLRHRRLLPESYRNLFDGIPNCSKKSCQTCHVKRVTPLDVVKVRLQGQAKPLKAGNCFICSTGLMDHLYTCTRSAAAYTTAHSADCPWYARPSHFTGTLDAIYKIARYEGIASLWSGLSPTMVMALPATVGYFFMYDNLRLYLRQKWGDGTSGTFWAPVAAGAGTRFVMVTAVAPFEVVRTKLQSEQLTLRDLRRVVAGSIREHGVLSLWRGWVPTIYRDVPFSALYWAFYEVLKSQVLIASERHETSFGISFSCGAIAGSIAAAITLPFDVIKTQRQIALGEHRSDASTRTHHLLQHVYRTNGIQGLFAGFIPRVARVAPSCAIMIGSYEYGKIFFARRNEQLENGTATRWF